MLLAVGGFVAVEGVRRLIEPPEVESTAMLWFGVIGLAGNLIGLAILASSRGEKPEHEGRVPGGTQRALGSVAVIVSAIVIATTGWNRADAVVSLLIAALIVPRALILLRDTIDVLMGPPQGLGPGAVRIRLSELPHVLEVHDLHASRIDSDTPVLSAHVTVHNGCLTAAHLGTVLTDLQRCVARFPSTHRTLHLPNRTGHPPPHWTSTPDPPCIPAPAHSHPDGTVPSPPTERIPS
ncbi:cation diffusion facilitator family transporter [Micrococcus luteus]|uniref:cation diffusion facilitator family transporter n=1 Tax=Micrococcus luteus TaxID=1270 RepID=UPI00211BF077|nr:cation diffusion facilitator family transporter [Micrococcus luteus]